MCICDRDDKGFDGKTVQGADGLLADVIKNGHVLAAGG